jgi:hypothetical protein
MRFWSAACDRDGVLCVRGDCGTCRKVSARLLLRLAEARRGLGGPLLDILLSDSLWLLGAAEEFGRVFGEGEASRGGTEAAPLLSDILKLLLAPKSEWLASIRPV